MCIIIVNKSNLLPYECFVENEKNNPDGTGIFYAENKKLIVKKFMPNTVIDEIYNYYKDIRSNFGGTIVIHFRKMSRGVINFASVHPFFINENLVMAHNGTINGLGNEVESDSRQLADILAAFPPNFIYNEKLLKLIKIAIGSSRLVFMNNEGEVKIIDEENMGEYYKGDWYSKGEFYRY